ncbi:LysR family transcriptional regulator [Caballeronia sp. LZ025]|uniref:LysR family transcriptional regulator n=1 Tax=Caballeronia TaxID=1827195 RepID=UPI001FD0EF59|nr:MULTISPECIES: LysR family transcriptional regulator [Caballeronia]MDR5733942.1 LysR family transcriptional regulator [Caballeronia sp. LZ025]
MNSDDLAFFCLVADAGSIAAAAISAGCDASTVSRRIAQLEISLKTRLFNRSGRGLTLAPQGVNLLDYARQVGTLMEAARGSVEHAHKQGPARVHLAAQPTIAKNLFGRLFHALSTRFPESQLHFTEAKANKIMVDLQAGSIDIAIIYLPAYPGSLTYEPMLFERLCLITPPGFPVDEKTLRTHAFADIPFVLPSTTHGIRVLVEEMLAHSGCKPRIVLQSDSSIAINLDLVAQHCGCTVLPLAAAQEHIASGRVSAYPLEGPLSERCIALVNGRTTISAGDLWTINALIRKVVAEVLNEGTWQGTRAAAQKTSRQRRGP